MFSFERQLQIRYFRLFNMAYRFSHKGGRQGSKRRQNDNSDVFLSKTLTSILRHNAEQCGLQLMKGGFLYVDDILKRVNTLRGFDPEDVIRVVNNDDKNRFTLENDGRRRLKIRANQGHSVEVEDLELAPILSSEEA